MFDRCPLCGEDIEKYLCYHLEQTDSPECDIPVADDAQLHERLWAEDR